MGTVSAMMAQVKSFGLSSEQIPALMPVQIQALSVADQASIKLEAMATAIISLIEMFKNILQMQQAGATKPRSIGIVTTGMRPEAASATFVASLVTSSRSVRL